MASSNNKELPPPPPGKTGWPWTDKPSSLPDKMPDGSPWPKISIVTPSYNQGEYIESTIRSVLMQGYPNLEYFIFDGASEDDTVNVIKKYEPWITFWVSEPDRGQTHAISKGFERAGGEIFHWLNSDDMLTPRALEKAALARSREADAVAWVGSCERITPDGKVLSTVAPTAISEEEIAHWNTNYFYQPACFIDMKAMRKTGGLKESLYMAFDLDLWLKLAKIGRFAKIDDVLARAIVHPEAKTQSHLPYNAAEILMVLFENGHREAAMKSIQTHVETELKLRRKLGRITSLPGYRIIRPFLKMLGLAG